MQDSRNFDKVYQSLALYIDRMCETCILIGKVAPEWVSACIRAQAEFIRAIPWWVWKEIQGPSIYNSVEICHEKLWQEILEKGDPVDGVRKFKVCRKQFKRFLFSQLHHVVHILEYHYNYRYTVYVTAGTHAGSSWARRSRSPVSLTVVAPFPQLFEQQPLACCTVVSAIQVYMFIYVHCTLVLE